MKKNKDIKNNNNNNIIQKAFLSSTTAQAVQENGKLTGKWKGR